MNADDLRIKIYERLGLEVGSLSSESGNDWVRAEKEILDEHRQEQIQLSSVTKKIDFKSIDKNSDEYAFYLTTFLPRYQHVKTILATRQDLDNTDITEIIRTGSQDAIRNLIRIQELSIDQINSIIPSSVFLTKKYLIEYQELNNDHKQKLLSLMEAFPDMYKDLMTKLTIS